MTSVKPLREEFERRREAGLITAHGLADILGWYRPRSNRPKPTPDDGRVRSTLGLRKYNPSNGYPPRFREKTSDAIALKIAEALQLDPVEIGL